MCGLNDSFVTAVEKQLKQGFECGRILHKPVSIIWWREGGKKEKLSVYYLFEPECGLIYVEP